MSSVKGGFRRSIERDGFHGIHDDEGLVFKSTLNVIEDVVALARELDVSLRQAFERLMTDDGWTHRVHHQEFVHRLVWGGHSRESAEWQWKYSWRDRF